MTFSKHQKFLNLPRIYKAGKLIVVSQPPSSVFKLWLGRQELDEEIIEHCEQIDHIDL